MRVKQITPKGPEQPVNAPVGKINCLRIVGVFLKGSSYLIPVTSSRISQRTCVLGKKGLLQIAANGRWTWWRYDDTRDDSYECFTVMLSDGRFQEFKTIRKEPKPLPSPKRDVLHKAINGDRQFIDRLKNRVAESRGCDPSQVTRIKRWENPALCGAWIEGVGHRIAATGQ